MTHLWLNFIASIVASIAWPAALAFVVTIFRKEIVRLLPFLHVKGGDMEVSFRLAEAEKTAAELPQPTEPPPAETPAERSRFTQLYEASPSAAMVEIRRDLEAAMRELALRSGLDERFKAPRSTVRRLHQKKLISDETAAVLDDLVTIGNRAAHEDIDLTLGEALQYRSLADRVISVLNDDTVSLVSNLIEPGN